MASTVVGQWGLRGLSRVSVLGSVIPRPCLQLLELCSVLVGLEPRAVLMLGKYFITEQKLPVPLFFTGPYYVAQASPNP